MSWILCDISIHVSFDRINAKLCKWEKLRWLLIVQLIEFEHDFVIFINDITLLINEIAFIIDWSAVIIIGYRRSISFVLF